MLNKAMREIVAKARKTGWILEPDAKRMLGLAGVNIPDFKMAATMEEAVAAADRIGYPVVAKVVSPDIMHKSDVQGVKVGIRDAEALQKTFADFSTKKGFCGVLVEEMVTGTELIIGALIDYQFGPVILLGVGGTGVEIYQDTAIRMAPVAEEDVIAMVGSLKGAALLKGYRGEDPVNIQDLTQLMLSVSNLVMALEDDMASMDLNPVKCDQSRCVVADARIILAAE
jgi:succinyl-CoA synthetase beta subunit